MKSQLAQTSKGPIEYTLIGQGPVVLHIHGTSSNCFTVDETMPLVEAGFSVLTPSRPGYGRTPLDVGRTASDSAAALIELMDCLGIPSVAVIAVSGGGPTGIALAAHHPQRVSRLVLVAAQSCPENRPDEASYKNQQAFYGPMHSLLWGMLGLMGRLSPRSLARQTMAIFSAHDPDDVMKALTPADIKAIAHFYQGHSSRKGALNDATHQVGEELLKTIKQPVLVVHSREDQAVPFRHAELALAAIPQARLVESGRTGHFFWVGPDARAINQKITGFLREA